MTPKNFPCPLISSTVTHTKVLQAPTRQASASRPYGPSELFQLPVTTQLMLSSALANPRREQSIRKHGLKQGWMPGMGHGAVLCHRVSVS